MRNTPVTALEIVCPSYCDLVENVMNLNTPYMENSRNATISQKKKNLSASSANPTMKYTQRERARVLKRVIGILTSHMVDT